MAILGAGLAMALAMSPGAMAHQRPVPHANVSKNKKRGLFNDMVFPASEGLIGHKGACVTMAQQKRASQKHRNQARHKAALRR